MLPLRLRTWYLCRLPASWQSKPCNVCAGAGKPDEPQVQLPFEGALHPLASVFQVGLDLIEFAFVLSAPVAGDPADRLLGPAAAVLGLVVQFVLGGHALHSFLRLSAGVRCLRIPDGARSSTDSFIVVMAPHRGVAAAATATASAQGPVPQGHRQLCL